MKIIQIIVLLSLFSITYANDRAVRISKKMKTEQRVALVIGNNSYEGAIPPLRNAINDARAIKNILESKGFNVIYIEDGSKKNMRKVLKQFSSKIRKGGVGFFYFSGHGMEVDSQNYLIPIDAKIDEESDVPDEAISLGKITRRMQNAKNRLNIVVLDACRNNPFKRAVGTGGLAQSEPRGLFVSYSTGAGSVASDGKVGENGLFTKSLIKHMKKGLNLAEVFKQTRTEVFYASNKKQFPAIYDQTIEGNFYFTLPDPSSTLPTQSVEAPRPAYNDYKTTSKSISKPNKHSSQSFSDTMDDDFDSFMSDMN